MPVVVQPAFRVEILALKTQRIIDYSHIEPGYFPVGAIVRGPDDFAIGVCQFLGCSKVVQLVVVGLGFCRTEVFQQGQRAKAVRFVEVAAMALRVVFGDQFVALPEELRCHAFNGFSDASAKRVVAVTGALPVGGCDTD